MVTISTIRQLSSLQYRSSHPFEIHITFRNALSVCADGALSRFEEEYRFSRFLRHGHKTLIMTNQSYAIRVIVRC